MISKKMTNPPTEALLDRLNNFKGDNYSDEKYKVFNLRKMTWVGSNLRIYAERTRFIYHLEEVPKIQQILSAIPFVDHEHCLKASLSVEPDEPTEEAEITTAEDMVAATTKVQEQSTAPAAVPIATAIVASRMRRNAPEEEVADNDLPEDVGEDFDDTLDTMLNKSVNRRKKFETFLESERNYTLQFLEECLRFQESSPKMYSHAEKIMSDFVLDKAPKRVLMEKVHVYFFPSLP